LKLHGDFEFLQIKRIFGAPKTGMVTTTTAFFRPLNEAIIKICVKKL
jgi:hypothetical protein